MHKLTFTIKFKSDLEPEVLIKYYCSDSGVGRCDDFEYVMMTFIVIIYCFSERDSVGRICIRTHSK